MARSGQRNPCFTDVLELDLGSITAAISGPKRPQDRIDLGMAKEQFTKVMDTEFGKAGTNLDRRVAMSWAATMIWAMAM